jgi:hypothetical protein
MSLDDVILRDSRTSDGVPGPRTTEQTRAVPWVEPGQVTRRSRPPSEYWDVAQARWTTRSAVPQPRRGD